MKVNLFIYYGAIAHYGEVTRFMNQIGETEMYSFIMKNNLQYKNIGSVYNNNNLMIGKEIFWDFDFNLFKLKPNQNGLFKIESKTSNEYDFLSTKDENEIKSLLHQIGIYKEPEYYVFVNYEA